MAHFFFSDNVAFKSEKDDFKDVVLVNKTTFTFKPSWKDIMFVPYNRVIEVIVILLVTCSVNISLYQFGFEPELFYNNQPFAYGWVIEITYLVHTIVVGFHRFHKSYRSRRQFHPQPMLVIFFDIISCIPLSSIYFFLLDFSWSNKPGTSTLRMMILIKLVRIVRLVNTYLAFGPDPGIDKRYMIPTFHFLFTTILANIITLGYKQIMCYQCGFSTWSDFVEREHYNTNSKFEWFVVIYTYAYSVIMHNNCSLLVNVRTQEILLAILAMVLGLITKYVFLSGVMLAVYIQSLRLKFKHKRKMRWLGDFMETLNFSASLQKDVLTYYELIWSEYRGFITVAPIVNIFPRSLRREICTDIYWEAIMHSQIFSVFEWASKKDVCGVMRTEIFVAGELLFRHNHIKEKMVYIVSGVVDLLTSENESSAILSFGSGTILGEISSVLPTKSNGNFRCATLCHLHVLYFADLVKIVQRQPSVKRFLRRTLKERIFFAKLKRSILSYAGVDLRRSHIPWIKLQWKTLIDMKRTADEDLERYQREGYTSKFLNLLALEVTEAWNPSRICIRGKCPCVMQNNSSFRNFLHYLFLSTVFLQIIITAPMIAFYGKIHTEWYPILTILDFLYCLDIYIQSITATTVDKLKFVNPSEVFLHCTKQPSFLVDVLASIPWDYAGLLLGTDDVYVALLRLPRFLKIYKILILLNNLETKLMPLFYEAKIIKFIILNIFIAFFLTGLNYVSNCFSGSCNPYGWLTTSQRKFQERYGFARKITHFLQTVFDTSSIYFSLKIANHADSIVTDSLMTHLLVVLGYYATTICFLQLVAVVALRTEDKHNFFMYMDTLNELGDSHEHMKHLKGEINDFAKLQYFLHKNKGFEEIYTMDGHESPYLKHKIGREYIGNALKKTQLFAEANPNVVNVIANFARVLLVPAGHTVVKPHFKSFNLFVIMDGYCRIRSQLPGDLERSHEQLYTKYTCFPVISLFYNSLPAIWVETETTVVLLCVSILHLKSIYKAFPAEAQFLGKAINMHFRQFRHIMNPRKDSFFIEKMPTLAGTKVDVFHYSVLRQSVQRATVLHVTAFQKTFLRLMLTTYDPLSRTYIIYEGCKSVHIILRCFFCFILPFKSVYGFFEGYGYIFNYLDLLINLIDFFIRSHLQFYNKDGVRVSHVSSTLHNYITSSFAVDFIAAFPYRIMGISGLFINNSKKAHPLLKLLSVPLQFYRPIKLIDYIQSSIYVKHQTLIKLVGSMFWTYIMYTIATVFHLLLSFDMTDNYFQPFPASWLARDKTVNAFLEDHLVLLFSYLVNTLTVVYSFQMFSYSDHVRQILLAAVIYIIKCVALTTTIGSFCHGNYKLVHHQDHIRNYLQYTEHKKIGNRERDEMIMHVGNCWKKSKGVKPSDVLKDFHPLCKEEVLLGLYRQTLLCCRICCDAELSFFRILSCHLEERYFKKGAHIIRTNDVQGLLFFIASGSVDINLEDIHLSSLEVGGMFGCFNPHGMIRQTITAQANVHVKLLCIESKAFYDILSLFKSIQARMLNQHRLLSEYVKEIIPPDVVIPAHTVSSKVEKPNSGKSLFHRTIHETNAYYKFWDYTTNVHLSSISAIYCCFQMAIEEIRFIWIWALLDLYFLSNFYMRSHLSFTDFESGVVVSGIKPLIVRYVQSFLFYIDLISILPIYLVTLFRKFDHESYFLINKALRFVNLYGFFRAHQIKKNVPRHVQWVFLIYNALFILQAVFNFWYLAANYKTDIKVSASYLHVISMFTATGMHEPESIERDTSYFGINLAIAIVLQYLFGYLSIMVFQMMAIQYQVISRYRMQTDRFFVYSINERLSDVLVWRVWNYLRHLYKYHGGRQLPYLLTDRVPPYILQDHMKCIYGHLISKHFMFANTHVDFLRQLFQYLVVEFYLPGDVIVELGDCNGIMYFIEYGEVIEIESNAHELKFQILKEGAFGEIQGIFESPFSKTYKAFTKCSIVSLYNEDWFYLLDWFPASKETIFLELQKFTTKPMFAQTTTEADFDKFSSGLSTPQHPDSSVGS